jgi:hypothetical protein
MSNPAPALALSGAKKILASAAGLRDGIFFGSNLTPPPISGMLKNSSSLLRLKHFSLKSRPLSP